ncbi:MAG: hypothetical protein DWQ11_17820 [Proteobacteria bacterium]|nr:MAG: hypothetical protein DWQ11_17820 [Pseudomonadota bacterium]
MRPQRPSIANVLPADARDALVKAYQTAPSAADPLRRQKAIEKTTQRIKQQYPELFHLPKEIES